jgi:signal transduction histidine kinase
VTVAYIEPFEGNEKALGLDIASDPVRADALRRATDSGQPAVTSRITLVQERGQQFSVLLLVPVYAHQGVTERVDGRRRLPEGFLVGVFRLGDLIASVLERVPYRDMAVTVLDATAPPQEQLLMTMQLGQAPTSVVPRQESPQGRLGPLWATTIEVADRRWELRFHPTPAYVTTFRTWEVWVVLIGGLLFTGLLGGMLLVGTGRASVVERLVAERTVALERADWERRQALDQLAGRNRDLEMVLRVTSHDLKEPLRAVESFSQMIHENYATRFDAEGQDLLRRIVRATARLRLLLDEILTLSRTRHITVPMEQIDGRAIVDKVLERLEAAIREKRATVRVDERLPRLRVDQTWAVQAVYNLVLNALKFTKDQHPPEVEIGVYQAQPGEPPGQGFVVRDRGPGVAPAHRERIFELFQRAVGREVEGTGAGLAIVREVATRHGGAAWMRPREGGGSEFIITFGTTMGNPVP